MRYEVKRKALPAAATVKKMPLRPLRCEEPVSVNIVQGHRLSVACGSSTYLRKDIVVANERCLGGKVDG